MKTISKILLIFVLLVNGFVFSNEISNASESCGTFLNGTVHKYTTVRGTFFKMKIEEKYIGYVYLLSCDNISSKYYLGITKRTLSKRLKDHLYIVKSFSKNSKKHNQRTAWLKSILDKGQSPLIEEIDFIEADSENELESQLNYWEIFYISLFRSWGIKLVNNGDGGNQNLNMKMPESAKEKLRIAHTGKFASDSTRHKMSISAQKVIQSEEKKKRIAKTLMNHEVTDKTRKLIGEKTSIFMKEKAWSSKIDESDVFDILTLIKEGKMLKDIATQYNLSPSNISAIKNKRGWKHLWNQGKYIQLKINFDKYGYGKFSNKEVKNYRF